MARFQKGEYVKFNKTFRVLVPRSLSDEAFEWEPDALYITHDGREMNLHYAGEHSGESAAIFSLPTDPQFLRALAKTVNALAKKYAEREA
jgi:hypothetical protein